MKADQTLDWIVAIIVLLFIIVPFISSLFSKKKPSSRIKKAMHHGKQNNEQRKHPKEEIPVPLNSVKPKKALAEKKRLKYGSLKQAIVLSEILKRPYSED